MAGGLSLFVLFLAGCSHPSGSAASTGRTYATIRAISPRAAAALAARLANEQCGQRYHREPFLAGQNVAVFRAGKYSWGGLNEGAAKGYSALVTFDADGGDPRVEVYYSNDAEIPDQSFFEVPTDGFSDVEGERREIR